ncbi:MAG: S4 domain-containing protein [Bacteroidales bacterium]
MANEGLRIDKWLWAVRIYKTRSMATNACKAGKVLINGDSVKPSRLVKVGEVVVIKGSPVFYHYEITGLLTKRQSATIADEHKRDVTPQRELDKLKVQSFSRGEFRQPGAGRPTKRERRLIDQFKNKHR